MKTSERLCRVGSPMWDTYMDLPFVKGVLCGSLEPEKFRYYIMQCHWYLLQFAKVLSYGIAKSENEEQERFFFNQMQVTLMEDPDTYAELHITPEDIKNQILCKNNIAYTDFMKKNASEGGLVDVAVSLLTCYWSYARMGAQMSAASNPEAPAAYRRWAAKFEDADYQKSTQKMVDLIDTLTTDAGEEELLRLEEIVRTCSRHELCFWEMCMQMNPELEVKDMQKADFMVK